MHAFRMFLLGSLIVALAAGLSFADSSSKSSGSPNLANKDKIVGVWELVKSDSGTPPGFTLEFTKDGKLKAMVKIDDKTVTIGGTYTVDGDKITSVVKENDKEMKETDTIKTLTDKSLILVDPKGKADEFKKK